MSDSSKYWTLDLQMESDVGILTETVRSCCLSNRFDRVDTEEFVLACSEIAHNAVRHGQGGRSEIQVLKGGKMIRVAISDDGPGIPNIDLALREGYSTVNTSLGLGLEGAQRLVDNFVIKSSSDKGTHVTLEKYRPLSKDIIDYGLVSVPDNSYNYNGDQYVLKEFDGDSVLLGVIDGPGQGYDAHSLAQTCKQFVEKNYRKPLTELLAALNSLMKESNDETGITCSLARIVPGEITYAGLGDTHAYLSVDEEPFKVLRTQEGRLGYVHRIKKEYACFTYVKSMSIVLCTDGIRQLDNLSLELTDAQLTSNELFDNFHRPYGDATIFIAKYNSIL